MSLVGKRLAWIKMPLGMVLGIGPGDFMLDGKPCSPYKGGTPQLSAHVSCGQTVGRTKMPLGTDIGLSPSNLVRWGLGFPPKGVELGPGHTVRRRPRSPKRGTSHQPHLFTANVFCGQMVAYLIY